MITISEYKQMVEIASEVAKRFKNVGCDIDVDFTRDNAISVDQVTRTQESVRHGIGVKIQCNEATMFQHYGTEPRVVLSIKYDANEIDQVIELLLSVIDLIEMAA